MARGFQGLAETINDRLKIRVLEQVEEAVGGHQVETLLRTELLEAANAQLHAAVMHSDAVIPSVISAGVYATKLT